MEHLTADQRQQLHDLALGLIEADFTLECARDLGEVNRVQRAQRLLDRARSDAATWIIEFDQRVNAPVEG